MNIYWIKFSYSLKVIFTKQYKSTIKNCFRVTVESTLENTTTQNTNPVSSGKMPLMWCYLWMGGDCSKKPILFFLFLLQSARSTDWVSTKPSYNMGDISSLWSKTKRAKSLRILGSYETTKKLVISLCFGLCKICLKCWNLRQGTKKKQEYFYKCFLIILSWIIFHNCDRAS